MGLAGCLFFNAVDLLFANVMGTILTFQEERPIFLRDYSNRMYSVPAYYLAKILLDLPV